MIIIIVRMMMMTMRIMINDYDKDFVDDYYNDNDNHDDDYYDDDNAHDHDEYEDDYNK